MTKRIVVAPIGERWGVWEFDSLREEIAWEVRYFGLRIALLNILWRVRHAVAWRK